MNAQVNKFLHLPLVTGGIAAILVSGIALASVAVSGKGHYGGQEGIRRRIYVFVCTAFIGASFTFNWKTSGRL